MSSLRQHTQTHTQKWCLSIRSVYCTSRSGSALTWELHSLRLFTTAFTAHSTSTESGRYDGISLTVLQLIQEFYYTVKKAGETQKKIKTEYKAVILSNFWAHCFYTFYVAWILHILYQSLTFTLHCSFLGNQNAAGDQHFKRRSFLLLLPRYSRCPRKMRRKPCWPQGHSPTPEKLHK